MTSDFDFDIKRQAAELLVSFIEERGLLSSTVREWIFNRDAENLQEWSKVAEHASVRRPVEVYIQGILVERELDTVQKCVESLDTLAKRIQQSFNGQSVHPQPTSTFSTTKDTVESTEKESVDLWGEIPPAQGWH